MDCKNRDLWYSLDFMGMKLKILTILYKNVKLLLVNPPSLCESMLNSGGSCFFGPFTYPGSLGL